ncbi:hypothetical protein LCGC14_0264050 [marine sediment metagenome]|uniref:Uncharacterized protein n=1 Tax=marine sediment metagenome TaxID=412755 RepID=A0A0F9WLE4_9ZZZZ
MADHTVKERYTTAQTVSDDHGKGAEVLRQAVASHWEPSSAAGAVSSNHHVLDCEVDVIIRFLRVMSVDLPDADADLTISRNRAGTLTALAAAVAVDTQTTEIFENITLTLAINGLRKDDSVYAVMLRATASTESADWGVYLGWMPDVFSGDSDFRTY